MSIWAPDLTKVFSDSLGLNHFLALGHRHNPQFWPGAGRRGQRRKCLTAKGDGIIGSDRGSRHATIVAIMNLDRLPVHRKWEVSGYERIQLVAPNAPNDS